MQLYECTGRQADQITGLRREDWLRESQTAPVESCRGESTLILYVDYLFSHPGTVNIFLTGNKKIA